MTSDKTELTASGLHILLIDPLFRVPFQSDSTRSNDLAKRLIANGQRVSVLCLRGSSPADSARLDVDDVAFPGTTPGYPLSEQAQERFARAVAWRIWRYKDVDAILVADGSPFALIVAAIFSLARGIPMMIDVRRLVAANQPGPSFMERAGALAARMAWRIAGRRAQQIFVLSQEIRESVIRLGIAPEKVVASVLGCNPSAWNVGRSEGALSLAGAAPASRIVFYAGPMEPALRLERLVELAVTLHAQDRKAVAIVLCGDGPARANLEALANARDVSQKKIWFLPSMPHQDLVKAFAAADAVVASSIHPSLEVSAPFYNALAAARPLVLLDNAALRETIEARGAGIGIPDDPVIAARELAEFLADGDGLRRAGQQARAFAAGRFNAESILAELRGAIEQAVAAEPRALVMRKRMLCVKRAFDITVSFAALVVLSPILIGITIAIWIKMGWPPLFMQTRTGLKGKLFRIYKFRTMRRATDAQGSALPDEERLTPLGVFLRRTSFDELPELFNVLKGDMSVVGPRPLLPEYLPHYSAEQRRRHDLRPGITGWSQINGRNALAWEEKFKLDVWYVDNLSLWLDVKIIAKSVVIALSGRGVSAPGHATAPRFDEIMARREGAEDV